MRLISSTRRHCSTPTSSTEPRSMTPAAFTTPSMPPMADAPCSTARATDASSVISTANAWPRVSRAASASASALRSSRVNRRAFRSEELGGASPDPGRRAGDDDPTFAQASHRSPRTALRAAPRGLVPWGGPAALISWVSPPLGRACPSARSPRTRNRASRRAWSRTASRPSCGCTPSPAAWRAPC